MLFSRPPLQRAKRLVVSWSLTWLCMHLLCLYAHFMFYSSSSKATSRQRRARKRLQPGLHQRLRREFYFCVVFPSVYSYDNSAIILKDDTVYQTNLELHRLMCFSAIISRFCIHTSCIEQMSNQRPWAYVRIVEGNLQESPNVASVF